MTVFHLHVKCIRFLGKSVYWYHCKNSMLTDHQLTVDGANCVCPWVPSCHPLCKCCLVEGPYSGHIPYDTLKDATTHLHQPPIPFWLNRIKRIHIISAHPYVTCQVVQRMKTLNWYVQSLRLPQLVCSQARQCVGGGEFPWSARWPSGLALHLGGL